MKTNVPAAHDHTEAAEVLAKLGHPNADDSLLELATRLLDIGYAAGKREIRDELAAFPEAAVAVEIIDENALA